MKIRIWMSISVCAALWNCSTMPGFCAMQDWADKRDYPQERLDRYSTKIWEINRFEWTANVTGLVALLKDPDPWIRSETHRRISERFNVDRVFFDVWVGYNPWGTTNEIQNRASALEQGIAAMHGGRVYLQRGERYPRDRVAFSSHIVRPGESSGTNWEVFALSEIESNVVAEIVKEGIKDRTLDLISQAKLALHLGNKHGAHALRALLDHQDENIRGAALDALIKETPAPVTQELLARKRAEWLEWWRTNDATYVPPAKPHPGPL